MEAIEALHTPAREASPNEELLPEGYHVFLVKGFNENEYGASLRLVVSGNDTADDGFFAGRQIFVNLPRKPDKAARMARRIIDATNQDMDSPMIDSLREIGQANPPFEIEAYVKHDTKREQVDGEWRDVEPKEYVAKVDMLDKAVRAHDALQAV